MYKVIVRKVGYNNKMQYEYDDYQEAMKKYRELKDKYMNFTGVSIHFINNEVQQFSKSLEGDESFITLYEELVTVLQKLDKKIKEYENYDPSEGNIPIITFTHKMEKGKINIYDSNCNPMDILNDLNDILFKRRLKEEEQGEYKSLVASTGIKDFIQRVLCYEQRNRNLTERTKRKNERCDKIISGEYFKKNKKKKTNK